MEIVDKDLQSIQEVRQRIAPAKEGQKRLQEYSQEQIDRIVSHVAEAAEKAAVRLAKLAHEETGFGKWEDKVIKNTFASKYVYNNIKDMKTVGIISTHPGGKVVDIAVPVGVIAGLVPSTNPTSTVIYKSLLALKTGNAILFSPHPSAKRCITETVDILSAAAVEAGAPEGVIGCLSILTMQGTNELMKHPDIALILATGGEAMVKAAYSSGTPAIGVGPGNGPAFIEKSADIPLAVKRIIDSKTFDNGVICASEQSIVVERESKEKVVSELKRQGAYFLNQEESERLGAFLLRGNGTINPQVVGKSAEKLAELTGLQIPAGTKVLISEQTTVSKKNPYSREKLCPILAFYCEDNWESACARCMELLANEGKGHTLAIHSNNEAIVREFSLKKAVSRVLVNTPAALGGIGASTDLQPALTLGCGAVGGSSTSDNVGPMNLLNIRRLAYGVREIESLRNASQTEADNGISGQDVETLVKEILKRITA
jgi:acetaldehyde dehydrogenase (acetylating)